MKKKLFINTILMSVLAGVAISGTIIQSQTEQYSPNINTSSKINEEEEEIAYDDFYYENTIKSQSSPISLPNLTSEELLASGLDSSIDPDSISYEEYSSAYEIPSSVDGVGGYIIVFRDISYSNRISTQWTLFNNEGEQIKNGVWRNNFFYKDVQYESWSRVLSAHVFDNKMYVVSNQNYYPTESGVSNSSSHTSEFLTILDLTLWTPEAELNDFLIQSTTSKIDRSGGYYLQATCGEYFTTDAISGDDDHNYVYTQMQSANEKWLYYSLYDATDSKWIKSFTGINANGDGRNYLAPAKMINDDDLVIFDYVRDEDEVLYKVFSVEEYSTEINFELGDERVLNSKKIEDETTGESASIGFIEDVISLSDGGAMVFGEMGDWWVLDSTGEITYSNYLGEHETESHFEFDKAYQLHSGIVATTNVQNSDITFFREDGQFIETIPSPSGSDFDYNLNLEDGSYLSIWDKGTSVKYETEYSYMNDQIDVDYTVKELNENVAFTANVSTYEDVRLSLLEHSRTLYGASLDPSESTVKIYKDPEGTEEGKFETIENGDFYVTVEGNGSGYTGKTPVTKIVLDLGARIGSAKVIESSQTTALIQYKLLFDEANNIVDSIRIMDGTNVVYSEDIVDNEYSGLIKLDGYDKNQVISGLTMEMDIRLSADDTEGVTKEYAIDSFSTVENDIEFASDLIIDTNSLHNRNVVDEVEGNIRIYDDYKLLNNDDLKFRVIEKDNLNIARTVELDYEVVSVDDSSETDYISDTYNLSFNNINTSYKYYYLEGSFNGEDWTHIKVFDQSDNLIVSNIKPSNANDESFLTKLMIGLVIVGLAVILVVVMFFVIRRNFHHTH